MTDEKRKLLKTDLCARLQYGVRVQCEFIDYGVEEYAHDGNPKHSKSPRYTGNGTLFLIDVLTNRVQIRPDLKGLPYKEQVYFERVCNIGYASIDTCKPYLRKMGDMTREEHNKYLSLCDLMMDDCGYEFYNATLEAYEYLDSIFVDYRGMIKAGLAKEASKDMYNL